MLDFFPFNNWKDVKQNKKKEIKGGKRDQLQRGFCCWGGTEKSKVEKMEVSEGQRTTNVFLVEYEKGESTDNMPFALQGIYNKHS